MDHRPANLRPPLHEILVHHDHIDRPADSTDRIAQADGLGDAVLDVALNHQKVEIAVACEFATRCRSEQDYPGGRPDCLHDALSSQLDQLLRSHDQDSLPVDAASTRLRTRNVERDLQLSRTTIASMTVGWSARKHGIRDDDAEHAVENAVTIKHKDDGTWLYLGPSRSGAMLEVVKAVRGDGSELLIHAMPIREKHKRLLPGHRARR
jgi:hypothetical protein